MNLLYFGDMHLDKLPSSRIDDFRNTQNQNKCNKRICSKVQCK